MASNSTTGNAQVLQNGTWSTAVAFNVSTATISTVIPASGAPGTSITITGAGFGASQGMGQIWLGSMPRVVQTWSDTQIVAVVATGSGTASAQVLQGGVMSNAIPFPTNTPQISAVNPGSAAAGTSVTITGTGFGNSQGSGSALLGSLNGTIVSWSDTQIVEIT